MQTVKFHIYQPGDPSVGIWASTYTVTAEIPTDENEADGELRKDCINDFRKALHEFFEAWGDDSTLVETDEEIKERCCQEQEWEDQCARAEESYLEERSA